jgi:hypothetical protein
VHADDASGVQQSAEAVQTAVDTGKGGIFFGEGDDVSFAMLINRHLADLRACEHADYVV